MELMKEMAIETEARRERMGMGMELVGQEGKRDGGYL